LETLRERPEISPCWLSTKLHCTTLTDAVSTAPSPPPTRNSPGAKAQTLELADHPDQQQHAADGQHEAGQDDPLLREPLGEAPGAQRGQQQTNGFRGEDDPGPDRVLPATSPGGYAAATKDTPMSSSHCTFPARSLARARALRKNQVRKATGGETSAPTVETTTPHTREQQTLGGCSPDSGLRAAPEALLGALSAEPVQGADVDPGHPGGPGLGGGRRLEVLQRLDG